LFEAAPFWYVYLMRKYTLSVSAFIMRHRLSFNTAVGANVHSTDWQDIFDHLHNFKSGKYIAGDYKAFDKNMPSEVLLAAFSCILLIAQMSGNYTDQDLYVMQGIQTDLVYPLLEFDTLMVKVFNSHCSGNSLTVILNNFANLLYIRCAYFSMYNSLPPRPFAQSVNIIVYGDDNVAEVHNDETLFNHTTCSNELAKFGIEYTMADKEAESVPFITISDVDFLKRRFLYCDTLGLVVAPLALTSIAKSLHFQVLSKGCDMGPRHLISDILRNTFDEIWCHGKDVYDRVAIQLYDVVLYHGLQHLVGPYADFTQHSLVMRKRFNIENTFSGEIDSPHYEIQSFDESSCGGLSTEFVDRTSDITFVLKHCKGELEREFSFNKYPNKYRCLCDTKSIEHSQPTTIVLDGTLLPMNNMICQASREDVDSSSTRLDQEVFTTDNAEPGLTTQVNTIMEDTQYTISPSMSSIANFLQRPVRIARYNFFSDVTASLVINPWELFLSNTFVRSKTNNYNFIRGRLHLHFEITGSPFRYGKFMISYLPCIAAADQNFDIGRIYTGPFSSDYGLIPNSQRMKVFLNSTNGQGADMVLPFMYPNDYLSLRFLTDWERMGSLLIQSLTPPSSINSNDQTGVTLNVYAHMKNVELVGPTSLVTQSAYEKGPLSRPASVIANVASTMVNTPVIGPYMRVTHAAATSLADVAALLGFSRPVSLASETKMLPKITSNVANVDAEDHVYKLSMDSKQERTIDPRTVDLGDKDEMSITNIVQIESYLGNFSWRSTDLSGAVLMNMVVTPVLFRIDTDVEPSPPIWMTPSCVVSQTFQYWRGGMKYRFMANSSSLYRGKLKISYEPASITAASELSENTNYTYIMDLAHTDDFTVCIHWCSDKHYLQTYPMFLTNSAFIPGVDIVMDPTRHNGKILVSVVNELTSPGDIVANCPISIFTSMCDDADFAVPTSKRISSHTLYRPQSGDSLGINLVTDKPSSTAVVTEFGTKIVDPQQNNVYFGEKVSSIRALLKRYVHVFTESDFQTASPSRRQLIGYVKWKLLGYRGFSTTGAGLSADGRYNFNSHSFLHWYRLAYVGERGSVRLKILKNGSATVAPASAYLTASYLPFTEDNNRVGRTDTGDLSGANPSAASNFYQANYLNSGQGFAITDTRINPMLEIELPDYSPFRYSPTSRILATTDDSQNILVSFERNASQVGFAETLSYFLASGEDYTLFYWAGFPPVLIQPTPAPSSGDPYPIP
jgi:hypothetical protein